MGRRLQRSPKASPAACTFRNSSASHWLGGQVEARQLAGRQPQQGAGAQWMQTDLDAGLTALVVDQRRAGVQTADEGVVRAGGLPGIGVTGQRERLIEGEDQGQPR
ncbi:hypothetical protein OG229_19435 [Streptomyces platensis]|nr:hypothetical protein OG229_19435 [Streptomyces platensis]